MRYIDDGGAKMLVWELFSTVSKGDTDPARGYGIAIARLSVDGFLVRDERTGSLCFIPSSVQTVEELVKRWDLGR